MLTRYVKITNKCQPMIAAAEALFNDNNKKKIVLK